MLEEENKEIEEGKFFAIISYISLLCVVSLALKKNNKFALYHAKQGLVLFVFEVVAFILSVIPFLGIIFQAFGFLFFVIVSLWCIIQVTKGKRNKVPFISDIAAKVVL